MTGLVVVFVVVFVLVLAGMCALLVLRMLSPVALPDSPRFPHRTRYEHHAKSTLTGHAVENRKTEELAEKL